MLLLLKLQLLKLLLLPLLLWKLLLHLLLMQLHLLLTLLHLLLTLLHLLQPSKLHGSAKKSRPAGRLFYFTLPLNNLAPAKPIQLIGHPDPFRLTI
ncbi:MAG: hypothetical protein KJ958_15625 [Gammaproteobacteria bacterium]|nr:hypothetical protein [Gammaproteobacteria bacterium]